MTSHFLLLVLFSFLVAVVFAVLMKDNPREQLRLIGWLTQSTPEASTEPAPVADIKKTLEKLGIGNRSRIVLYYTNGMLAPTCRIFVTLAYVGLGERTAILNGGLEEWKANGKPVSNETPAIHKTKLKISPDPQVFYEAKEILQNLHSTELTIVDVRPPAFYEGKSGSPRAGHIPGAKNLPLAKLYDEKTYKFLPKEKIVEEFAKAGIVQNKKVIALCGSGNTASILYFLCREEGYPVALYDGSMEQWANNFSLPMEKTEPQP